MTLWWKIMTRIAAPLKARQRTPASILTKLVLQKRVSQLQSGKTKSRKTTIAWMRLPNSNRDSFGGMCS